MVEVSMSGVKREPYGRDIAEGHLEGRSFLDGTRGRAGGGGGGKTDQSSSRLAAEKTERSHID